MSDFTFKGISASSLGVVLQTMPPITKAPMRYEKVNVDGRDGSVLIPKGYDSYPKPLYIGVKDVSRIDDIIAWLNGSGKLTISNEEGKYYDATVLEQTDFTSLRKFREANAIFEIQPYKYAVANAPLTFTSTLEVNNDGNVPCLPKLTITGTSGCTVKLDGVAVFTITSIDTSITIDSMETNCYIGETLLNRRMIGDFLEIPTGSHTITVTGTAITSCRLELNKRWR